MNAAVCSVQVEPFPGILAGQLLSYLASHSEDVAAAVKDIARQLKKTRAAEMPQVRDWSFFYGFTLLSAIPVLAIRRVDNIT